MKELIRLFPGNRRSFWEKILTHHEGLEEIRLRADRPILLQYHDGERFVDKNGNLIKDPSQSVLCKVEEIEEIVLHNCEYSLYAREDEIRQGFLTVEGGHRIGLSGRVIKEGEGNVRNLKNVTFLNLRISHEIKGAADRLIKDLYVDGEPCNCLIIAPPGCGKTTLLRDCIRQISNGNQYGKGVTVGVVDERSELAASYLGVPQMNLGIRTDVLDGCGKSNGILQLVRSMSPKVLALDEMGGEEDVKALLFAMNCGCKVVATIHGKDLSEIRDRLGEWWPKIGKRFDLFAVLGRIQSKVGKTADVKRMNGETSGNEEGYGILKIIKKEDLDDPMGRGNYDPNSGMWSWDETKKGSHDQGS